MEVTYTTLLRITRRYIQARMLWIDYENRCKRDRANGYAGIVNERRAAEESHASSMALDILSDITEISTEKIDAEMCPIVGDDLDTENAYKYSWELLERLGIQELEMQG